MVSAGVALHIPMFLMGRATHFRLVGMPMDTGMLIGMGLIVAGVGFAAYGLLPSGRQQQVGSISIVPPEDAPLTKAHVVVPGIRACARDGRDYNNNG